MNPYVRTPEIKAILRKDLPKDILEYDYCTRQLSFRQIAKEHNWSASNVRRKIREYEIPLRSHKDSLRTPSISKLFKERKSFLGKIHTKETRDRIKLKLALLKNNKEKYIDYIERQREGKRKFYLEHPLLASKRQINTYSKYSKEKRIEISEKRRQWWDDDKRQHRAMKTHQYMLEHPELRKSIVKNLIDNRKHMSIHPNKPENILLSYLESNYRNEWKFCGDGTFLINNLNPDFVNINGQKKLIEVYGDYWHRGENPQDRIDIFRKYGFDCMILWEHELNNIQSVISKINLYCNHKEDGIA